MFSLYHMFPICTPHMSWGLLGGISTSARHFCVFQYIHCLSVHNSHTSCSQSLWITSLVDWMPMDVGYASCCCSFLCSVLIMSQASTTMAKTTTAPVILCAPVHHLSSQWKCCWPCHCVTAAACVPDASSGLCQLCHGSSTDRFLSRN